MSKQIQLTKAQKVWLKEIHEKGNDFLPASSKARLHKQLGKGFRIESIPQICFHYHKHLSLVGIREIEPNSKTLKDADFLIRHIKKHIESGIDPIPDLFVDDIEQQAGIDRMQILRCLSLIERIDFRTHGSMEFLDWETGDSHNYQEQKIIFDNQSDNYHSH